MSTETQRTEAIIEFLSNELLRARQFFDIASTLHTAYFSKQLFTARYFFAGTYEACLREALISFSKLTLQDKNSITIDFLINHALYNPGDFKYTNERDVKSITSLHKDKLQAYIPLLENLKIQRDRVLAHLDKKHLNDPTAVFKQPIDLREVDACLELLLTIINDYKKADDNSQLYFGLVEKSIQEDISYILRLIQDANDKSTGRIKPQG